MEYGPNDAQRLENPAGFNVAIEATNTPGHPPPAKGWYAELPDTVYTAGAVAATMFPCIQVRTLVLYLGGKGTPRGCKYTTIFGLEEYADEGFANLPVSLSFRLA